MAEFCSAKKTKSTFTVVGGLGHCKLKGRKVEISVSKY